MKGLDFLKKINDIDADLLEDTEKTPCKRKNWLKWSIVAAACICIVAGCVLTINSLDIQVGAIGKKSSKYAHGSYAEIILSMPKFDVSSDINLVPVLQQLGVLDIFENGNGDFSPLTGNNYESSNMKITEVKHAARVTVDEEGCTATAFTTETLSGTQACGFMPQ